MASYLIKRVLATIPVMLFVAIFIFLLLRLTPGDPAAMIAGDFANDQQIAEIREKLGLEEPLYKQFAIWMTDILRFELGQSFYYKKQVSDLIITHAHYDHVGMDDDGNIYNGADDDGSGTVAMLEIAQAFQTAVKNGKGPKRSILFLHVTGEEIGLYGSRFYTETPIFPLANTVCNLNTDMVGRIDEGHADNPNYVYLIGSDKLSQELHDVSEMANKEYVGLDLDYKYNDDEDPNRFYYRSDHYNFAKNNIPVIFYFNGVHADYHQISDTPDKIEYELLAKRSQLIFQTAWEVANREGRITADKLEE